MEKFLRSFFARTCSCHGAKRSIKAEARLPQKRVSLLITFLFAPLGSKRKVAKDNAERKMLSAKLGRKSNLSLPLRGGEARHDGEVVIAQATSHPLSVSLR